MFDGIGNKKEKPDNGFWKVKTQKLSSARKSNVGKLFEAGMGVPETSNDTSRIRGKQRDYERYDSSDWKNSKIKYNLNH